MDEKIVKKFGHFEIWNDGMMRIRSPAIKDDALLVFFPCDIDEIEAAIKFQKDMKIMKEINNMLEISLEVDTLEDS